jgi:kynureninase
VASSSGIGKARSDGCSLTIRSGSGGDVADFARRYGHEYATVVLTAANLGAQHALDVAAIISAARAAGCMVGRDVSRLGGDPRPMLPEWGADFACLTAAGGSGGACAWIAVQAA